MQLHILLLLVVICLLVISVLLYARTFFYWNGTGIPYVLKYPLLRLGYFHVGILLKSAYDFIKMKGFVHAGGAQFFFPVYIPVAPHLIKLIMQQDFGHFTKRGIYYNEKKDPLSANLFALGGDAWKFSRGKLSPLFTLSKIKTLFDSVNKCGEKTQLAVEETVRRGEPVEIKELAARYTVDIIGSCVYGLECNSITNTNSEFGIQALRIFSAPLYKMIGVMVGSFEPKLALFFGVTVFAQKTRKFFLNLVRSVVDIRKKNCSSKKDVMQTLIKLLQKDENGKALTIEQIGAHAFVFFAAGFETSSSTIAFCLYELALNQEIQNKTRRDVLCNVGELDYDAVMEMKYLDQVIDETLRKYPPVSFVTRKCSKRYNIPDTNNVLPKGAFIFISILGLHLDPEYFPNPEKFDPDRFSPERRQDIAPFTYLPFGEGPRICIGLRFGLLQVKVCLIKLLSRYKFTLNHQTKTPLHMDPYSFTLVAKDGIYLNVEKIQ